MKRFKAWYLLAIIIAVLLSVNAALAADETVMFGGVAPNALIILDRSGSMNYTPAGPSMCYKNSESSQCDTNAKYYSIYNYNNSSQPCPTGYTACTRLSQSWNYYSKSSDCSDPIYATTNNLTSSQTDCSKLAIAKRAIFSLLDADLSDGTGTNATITSTAGIATDDAALGINMGYENFYNCGYPYNSSCITVPTTPTDTNIGFGSKYSQLYCGSPNTCKISSTYTSGIAGEEAGGGTPLGASLILANTYIANYENSDASSSCRNNFIILITDGADTLACPNVPSGNICQALNSNGNLVNGTCGTGAEDLHNTVASNNDYPRRSYLITQAFASANANTKIFTIGFGSDMPTWDKNALSWAAYWGEPKNKSNTGISIMPSSSPCSEPKANDPGAVAPPGNWGYFAQDSASLGLALQQALNVIQQGTFSFSISSISTARITSENNLYEASFQTVSDDPFWWGHLKKYTLNADGSVGASIWDAGTTLLATTPTTRAVHMKTLIGGALTPFSTSLSPTLFGLASTATAARDGIVSYFQGNTPDGWLLGDIFHSTPVVLTSPSPYWVDKFDNSATPNAFANFRTDHQRTSANGQRVVVVGANDGQMHVFETNLGGEVFSFIPPNLLPKLSMIAHTTYPLSTAESHQYYVDGPISASDVWLGTGSGASKSEADWKTIAVVAEGRGAGTQNKDGSEGSTSYLWSTSATCDSGTFSGSYGTATPYYPYYCGYYAFDFTVNTNSPTFLWTLKPSAALAPYLAEPWSKMAIGRVKISGNEKWVGFIGGGGYSYSCAGSIPNGSPSTAGQGFLVVDLSNGQILWSYTHSDNSAMSAIPAPPSIVDTDNDGYIDTAYVGDLAGNVWRFRFCSSATDSTCSTSSWKGSVYYSHETTKNRPIYGGMSVTKDTSGNVWTYWGTGDKQCPEVTGTQDKLYGMMDKDFKSTYTSASLKAISGSETYNIVTDSTLNGWSRNLGLSEKMSTDPLIFAGITFFSTFTPTSSSNSCQSGGTPQLYGLNYMTGGGALAGGAISMSLGNGNGMPSAPNISLNPTPANAATAADIYVTVSGNGSTQTLTKMVNFNPPMPANRSNVLYWKDRRVQ